MNIKPIAIVGVCFVAGTSAGTVYGMRSAAAAAAEHGAEAADSLHAADDETSHADGEATDERAAADAEHAVEAAQDPDAAHGSEESHVEPAAAASPAAAGTAAVSGADEGTARLARIFGAMRPEEAARLLEPLPEGDVRAVLFALSERKAAAILANFKGERAAALTRALITNGGGH